jgi:hypothetical protein
MKVTISHKYARSAFRHWPRRFWERETTTEAEIREITGADAPVAFRHFECGWPTLEMEMPREYRLYQGNLYCRGRSDCFMNEPVGFMTQDQIPRHLSFWLINYRLLHEGATLEMVREKIAEFAARFLIVDGEVWELSCEPKYEVSHYGLSVFRYGNTSLPGRRFFNALEYDAAVDAALECADELSLPYVRNPNRKIEVCIPEAVHFQRTA